MQLKNEQHSKTWWSIRWCCRMIFISRKTNMQLMELKWTRRIQRKSKPKGIKDCWSGFVIARATSFSSKSIARTFVIQWITSDLWKNFSKSWIFKLTYRSKNVDLICILNTCSRQQRLNHNTCKTRSISNSYKMPLTFMDLFTVDTLGQAKVSCFTHFSSTSSSTFSYSFFPPAYFNRWIFFIRSGKSSQ